MLDGNWGGQHGLVVGVFNCGPTGRWFESVLCQGTLTFPQWSMTGWVRALVCPAVSVRLGI